RLPASFFVSVAYNCWAFRRQGVLLDGASGGIKDWLYPAGSEVPMQAGEPAAAQSADAAAAVNTEQRREVRLKTPLTEEQVRSLRVGDIVILDGEIHTGRDA